MSFPDDALRILAVGVTINCTAAAVTPTLLPLNTNGEAPRAVRVQAEVNPVYVKVGPALAGANSAQLAVTLNDILVHPNSPLLLSTRGCQYIGGITRGAAVTSNLNVTPVDL